jgi:hypothetical protein
MAVNSFESELARFIDARIEAHRTACGFEWGALDEFGLKPRQARRLAKREGIAITRIGRTLFLNREQMRTLAAKNTITVANTSSENDGDDDLRLAVGLKTKGRAA